jgi:very-short-patch-repair endonuclease
MPHAAVSEQHRHRAKHLRRAMTRAEILLWRYLKAHHLDGLSFRRQAPMGQYIIDFVCHTARLIVELDGETHDFEERQRHDAVRDEWLASRGYCVLRFTNEKVLCSLEGVLTVIRETATARIRSTPPSLSLPRRGGGNPQTTAVQLGNAGKQLPGAQK